jgi:cytochrome c oxidase subunit 2
LGELNPVTPGGGAIAGLFWVTMAASVVVFVIVAGPLAVSIARFRARPGESGEPVQVHGDRRLELIWTVGPALLIGALFVFALVTMGRADAEESGARRVRVVGWQWWWEYQLDDGAVTANELHLPLGAPIRLELTSGDVIHAFWIIRFGWKRDLVPGRLNVLPLRVEQPGTYEGACAEYCGTQHAWMRPRVVAEPPEAFEAWLARQSAPADPPTDPLARRGQAIFLANTCVNCHTVRGTAASARIGPDLTHFGGRTTLGAGVAENTPAELRRWLRNAQELKPGVLMPPYPNLPEEELDALVAYLRGLS